MDRNKKIHLTVAFLYAAFLVCVVYWMPHLNFDITIFGITDKAGWRLWQLEMSTGILWGASISSIKDELLRQSIRDVAYVLGGTNIFMLLLFNNDYSNEAYLFQIGASALCGFYIYWKLNRNK